MAISKKHRQILRGQKIKTSDSQRKVIRNSSYSIEDTEHKKEYKRPKKVITWNFEENQLVRFKKDLYNTWAGSGALIKSGDVGLIISNKEYKGMYVEKNYFWVFTHGHVLKVEGSSILAL